MNHSAAFRRALETMDAPQLMKLWRHISPNLPQPANLEEAMVSLHYARTQALSMSLKARLYSHAWLTERGYPSGLPYEFQPKVERPAIVSAIGVAISHQPREGEAKERAGLILHAMTNAAGEMHSDGETDPAKIRKHILLARDRARVA